MRSRSSLFPSRATATRQCSRRRALHQDIWAARRRAVLDRRAQAARGATLNLGAHETPPQRDHGDAARTGGTRRAPPRTRPRSRRDERTRGPWRPREARVRSGRANPRRGAASPARRAGSAARDRGRPSRQRRGPPCRLDAAVTTTLLRDNSAWSRSTCSLSGPKRSFERAPGSPPAAAFDFACSRRRRRSRDALYSHRAVDNRLVLAVGRRALDRRDEELERPELGMAQGVGARLEWLSQRTGERQHE